MYSHEQLKLMNAAAISICSQRHIQSVIEELIETALAAAPTPAESPADAARLDWLVASDWYIGPEYGADEAGGIVGYDNKNIDGLRAAIDAAIAAEKGGA